MSSASTAAPFLESADRLGSRLCRDAFWAGERCNWLGWSLEPVSTGWSLAWRSQTPYLYDGTAGIALFLGHLYQRTGDPLQRATLLGAVAHFRQAMAEPGVARQGFHGGAAGVAHVAFELAEILMDEELSAWGLDLLLDLSRAEPDGEHLDLIAGSAGSIPVFLSAAARFGHEELHAAALRHGQTLLDMARSSAEGCSWDVGAPAGLGPQHLVGYPHGTAGIACALLELYRATGESSYRSTALEALRTERAHFSAEHGNWPDLRVFEARIQEQLPDSGQRFVSAWCHGAPGIGFSRLRILRLLAGDSSAEESNSVREELEVALSTTAADLGRPFVAGVTNFSLCHGLAGNADLLLTAAGELVRPELGQTAEAVGRFGQAYFDQPDQPWPCGVQGGGETPNLLLGLAGIGYFFLRLYAPEEVPSLLLLHLNGEQGATPSGVASDPAASSATDSTTEPSTESSTDSATEAAPLQTV